MKELKEDTESPIVVRCAIWYHLHNLKNVKNTHEGVLILVTKSNTPPWIFFTFFKLCKSHQIAQRTTISTVQYSTSIQK